MMNNPSMLLLLLLDVGCVMAVAALNGDRWDFDGPLTMSQLFLISGIFGFVGVLVGVSFDGCNDVKQLARHSLGNFGISFAATPLTVVQICKWTGWPQDISIVAPVALLYGIGGMMALRSIGPMILNKLKARAERAMDEKLGISPQSQRTLLIVEDDANYRAILAASVRVFCRLHNLRVQVVSSISEAGHYIADAEFLLCDWRLGDGTNADIIKTERFIKAVGIKTVIVTGASASVTLQPSATLGIVDKRTEEEPLPVRINSELMRLADGQEPKVGM